MKLAQKTKKREEKVRHMPRACPGVPRALAVSGWDWCLSAILPAARRTDSSDFGLLGSKVPQNWRFPAQDASEPPCKI